MSLISHMKTKGSLVNKIDLQASYLSGTYCHETGTGPPSFGTPRQPTIFVSFQVFRDLIKKCNIAKAGEMEAIFSNVTDITELTMTLIGSLEDTLEMTEEGNSPGN